MGKVPILIRSGWSRYVEASKPLDWGYEPTGKDLILGGVPYGTHWLDWYYKKGYKQQRNASSGEVPTLGDPQIWLEWVKHVGKQRKWMTLSWAKYLYICMYIYIYIHISIYSQTESATYSFKMTSMCVWHRSLAISKLYISVGQCCFQPFIL